MHSNPGNVQPDVTLSYIAPILERLPGNVL